MKVNDRLIAWALNVWSLAFFCACYLYCYLKGRRSSEERSRVDFKMMQRIRMLLVLLVLTQMIAIVNWMFEP